MSPKSAGKQIWDPFFSFLLKYDWFTMLCFWYTARCFSYTYVFRYFFRFFSIIFIARNWSILRALLYSCLYREVLKHQCTGKLTHIPKIFFSWELFSLQHLNYCLSSVVDIKYLMCLQEKKVVSLLVVGVIFSKVLKFESKALGMWGFIHLPLVFNWFL